MSKVIDFKEPQKHSRSRRYRLGHHPCSCVTDARVESIQLHHQRRLAVSAVLSSGEENQYGHRLSCSPLAEIQRHDINLAELPSPSLTPESVPPKGRVYRKEQTPRTHGLGHALTDKSK